MMCPFCGEDPFEYVDVGIGFVPVAITCCEWGWYVFDGGEKYDHCGMPMDDILKIKQEIEQENTPQQGLQVDFEIPF